MTYRILISRSAEKELFKLSDTGYKRIAKAIDDLAENPRPAGVKKLKAGRKIFGEFVWVNTVTASLK